MSQKEHKEEEEKEKQETTPQAEQEVAATADNSAATAGMKDENTGDEESGDLSAKLDELNDKYLRLYSDFDNYRRRTLKDIGDIRKNASEDLVVKLLPVLDDFERAVRAFGSYR